MTSDCILQVASIILGAGGGGAFILSLLKVRPEAGQMVVTAAQGALLVQTGVIENQAKEITRVNALCKDMQSENSDLRNKLASAQGTIASMQIVQDKHELQIQDLQAALDRLHKAAA
jgi:hypothetical protein